MSDSGETDAPLPSDAEVEGRFARGEDVAELLAARHYASLLGYIRARVRDPHAAQDLAQEVWVKALRQPTSFNPERGPFVAFLRNLAHYEILAHWSRATPQELPEVLPDSQAHLPGVEEELALYEDLLEHTFAGPSPPHQLLALGFIKLLGWKPQDLVAKLMQRPLRELLELLIAGYSEVTTLPEEKVRGSLRPLLLRMDQGVEAALGPGCFEPYRESEALAHGAVGDTRLQDYVTGAYAEADVGHWWDSSKRRLLSWVRKQDTGLLRKWLCSTPDFRNKQMLSALHRWTFPAIEKGGFRGKLPDYRRITGSQMEVITFEFLCVGRGGLKILMAVGHLSCGPEGGAGRDLSSFVLRCKTLVRPEQPAGRDGVFEYEAAPAPPCLTVYEQIAKDLASRLTSAGEWWRQYETPREISPDQP